MNRKNLAWAVAASIALAFGGVTMAAETGAMAAPAPSPDMQMQAMNWFGGPIYNGAPSLKATAALVRAGGGAENFSFATALVSMLGQKTVNAEVAKLNKQYGEEAVNNFIAGMDFAVTDGLKRATEAGIALPEAPADLKGTKLATALVGAGTTPDGTFWSGYLFDHALSHKLHNLVMADIDAKLSHGADKNTHKILNQAMYDVAQALGQHEVKLASLH
ncbi:MAG TPA: hypothetical protein VFJ15_03955 [Oleiagrimonas sp.]|nr:hypothetical protein [Oleiagrimonas sp.]